LVHCLFKAVHLQPFSALCVCAGWWWCWIKPIGARTTPPVQPCEKKTLTETSLSLPPPQPYLYLFWLEGHALTGTVVFSICWQWMDVSCVVVMVGGGGGGVP